ncbi:MAG: DUF2683 family protein [Cytophagales bacterium]
MSTITINIQDNSKIETLTAFLKALKIEFSISQQREVQYNSEFEAKMKLSEQQLQVGASTRIKISELDAFFDKL